MKQIWIIAAALGLVVMFIAQKVQDEYAKACAKAESIRLEVVEAIETSTEAVKSFQATSDSIRETITDIKDRLARVELSQLELARTTSDSLQDNSAKLAMKLEALQTKLDEQPKQPESKADAKPAKSRIVMHTGDGCGACNNWIAKTMPGWQANGWEVELVKEVSSPRGWPWFEVYPAGGKRFEVDGPLTKESYDRALQSAK